MNHVILTGRLTKNPEIRYTNTSKAVASFTLAVDDSKVNGERRSQFISCVAWGKTAELIQQYFHKGDPLTVIGRITVRRYEKDGDTHWVTEVVASGIEFPLTKERVVNARDIEPGGDFEEIADDEELPF